MVFGKNMLLYNIVYVISIAVVVLPSCQAESEYQIPTLTHKNCSEIERIAAYMNPDVCLEIDFQDRTDEEE